MRDSGYARIQLEEFDLARRVIARYPDRLALALSADDIEREFKRGRVASLLGMEGGHVLENSLGTLRAYYDLGARYLTLTHNVTLDWADAAADSARHGGLTEFGREVVREMNRLGMLVDLSHVSPGTMSDALDVTEAPVIFSHSSARALTEHVRNVPDSILARLKSNGGVVMVTFVGAFVSQAVADWEARYNHELALAQAASADTTAHMREWEQANPRPQATLAQVADHLDHVRQVAGPDHVGSEATSTDSTIRRSGLEDVSRVSLPVRRADPPRLERRGSPQAGRAEPAAGASGRPRRPPRDSAGSGSPPPAPSSSSTALRAPAALRRRLAPRPPGRRRFP